MALKTVNEESLVALGNAIREKTNTNDLLVFPNGMIDAINSITGAIEVPEIEISGNGNYACAGLSGEYINLFGDKIKTRNLSNAQYMFSYCSAPNIPFEINFSSSANMQYMFRGCKMRNVPVINNAKPSSLYNFFADCYYLRYIPDNFGENWDWSSVSNSSASVSYFFINCFSLRQVPAFFKQHCCGKQSAQQCLYYSTFQNCYTLDEIVDLPVYTATALTSNVFNSTVSQASRIKDFTFEVNTDGTPKIAQWKGQTFNMTYNVGYLSSSYVDTLTGYNTGLTKDTRITNDENYQLLKDNPDAWTVDIKYSRYNHDSAVRTINSLPDTSAYLASAGGTNTIKFKGASGSATDGGAINTLTEEEIAVATAKGWTVSLA